MSEDRPKKSWRDVDRSKDRSAHRREERPAGSPQKRERTQKTYRAALDRLFTQGGLGKILPTDGEGTPESGPNRIRLLVDIRGAAEPDEITRAIDAFVRAFGDLPDEVDLWAQAAWHDDIEIVRTALSKLPALLASQPLKRTRALVGRLRYLEDLAEDPEMRRQAAELRRRIA